jgi:hypothetical protein
MQLDQSAQSLTFPAVSRHQTIQDGYAMMKKIFLAGAALAVAAPMTLSAQLAYDDFSSIGGVNPVGAASQQKSVLRLTPTQPWVAGGLWSAEKQQVADGFTTEFSFRITAPGGAAGAPNSDGGADGLAFVIQNSSPAALGEIGHQIGYGGIPNSLAIEIDTWNNAPMGNGDPNNNHISVQTAGTEANSHDHHYSLGAASDIPRLDDGRTHTLRAEYADGRMKIAIDGKEVLDIALDLSATLSLDEGRAWVGFTSATARAWENHDLLSWSFSALKKSVEEVLPEISENETEGSSGSFETFNGANAITGMGEAFDEDVR